MSSYLQTLPQADAVAFISSLQKVKDHLSGELEWTNQQVEQKTLQLQGVDALLSELVALGSTTSQVPSAMTAGTEKSPSPTVETTILPTSDAVKLSNDLASHAASNETASSEFNPPTESPIVTTPTPTQLEPKPKGSKITSSKSHPKAQSVTAGKTRTSTAKKANLPNQSTLKEDKSSKTKEFRELLLPKFEGRTLTDAVNQILESTTKPLHLNELLSQMYGSLSASDFKRAKVSLASVLSIGKKEGKWQSLGGGLYAANKVATA